MQAKDKTGGAGAATRLLLQQRLHSLSVDVTRLHYDKPIVFDSLQHFCATTRATLGELTHSSDISDGLTLRRSRGGQTIYVVLYNQAVTNIRRRNFTLAHEIGHIYLGHHCDQAEQEREASQFAAQLLLPRILVAELCRTWGSSLSVEDICSVFFASRYAVEHRLRSLSCPTPFSDDDRALLRRFGGLLPKGNGPVITI